MGRNEPTPLSGPKPDEEEVGARYPDTDYLSASLELNESGNGEMRKLTASPLFDKPRMQIAVIDGNKDEDDDEYEVFVELNRAQIQCLTDFLVAWLQHAPKLDQAANAPSQRPLAEGAGPESPHQVEGAGECPEGVRAM